MKLRLPSNLLDHVALARTAFAVMCVINFMSSALAQRAKLAVLLDGDVKSSFAKTEQTKVPLTGTAGLRFGPGDVDLEAKVQLASSVDTVTGSDYHTFGNVLLLPEMQAAHLSALLDLKIRARQFDEYVHGFHFQLVPTTGEWRRKDSSSQEITVIGVGASYTLSWDTHDGETYGGWLAEAGFMSRMFGGDIQSQGEEIRKFIGSTSNFFWGPFVQFEYHYNGLRAFLSLPYFISGSDPEFVPGLSKMRFYAGIGIESFIPVIK